MHGDARAAGVDQPLGRVVADERFIRFDAGIPTGAIRGVDEHQRIIVQRFRHVGETVRHLRVKEPVHPIAFQRAISLASSLLPSVFTVSSIYPNLLAASCAPRMIPPA